MTISRRHWVKNRETIKAERHKPRGKIEKCPPGNAEVPMTVSELEQVAGKNKNSHTRQGQEEVSSGQKVRRLQLFEITHRKKDRSPMTSEVREIMEKLKGKKAEYEAIASTDSSINLENIDNRIITKVLGLERYGRV
ncbi:Matrix metalloproteinase-21 [Gossypium arboreum]|uniref:Matrix metalloproteinase-21 n=1 Tax=Gossypium arboreum TaxID=29729 RepID=A0A0B0ME77_GOSAR|nr:Matrix metalloproteinase-21 [Gossypium arboreum]